MPDDKKTENYKEEVLGIKKFYAPSYIIAIVIIMAMGMYFLANIDTAYKNKLVPNSYEALKTETDIQKKSGSVMPGADLAKVGFPNAALIEKGKELFKNNCASCHGETGMGDGAGAAALNPKPRNFHQKDGWKNGRQFTAMYRTLLEGIPNSGMNAYAFMPVEDRICIMHYVRTFADDFPPVTKEELTQADAMYSISKGTVTPANIPSALAVEKLIAEAQPTVDKVKNMAAAFGGDKDPGAAVFNANIVNAERAITTLMHNSNWKNSKENLFMLISYSVPENGFKPQVLTLKTADQNALYAFLKSKM